MTKVNRYWNSDPSSLVEYERPETYDLCKSCQLVNQLLYREKMLKYELWLTRADRAKAWFLYWCARFGVESGFTKCDINGNFMNTKRTLRMIRDWINLWKNVERKCRDKALKILKER